jgi:hypothetical protein
VQEQPDGIPAEGEHLSSSQLRVCSPRGLTGQAKARV